MNIYLYNTFFNWESPRVNFLSKIGKNLDILIRGRTNFRFTDTKSYTTTRTCTYLYGSSPLLY